MPVGAKKPMRRIAFIDAAHHRETKSSRFLFDFLSPFFDIDVYWDGSHLGESKPDVTVIEQDNYDIIFIFEIGTDLNVYSRIDCQSIVCVPPLRFNDNYVSEYFPEKFKYLCMSKAQHQQLSLLGRNSRWFQYYPNPYDFIPHRDYSRLKGFYWCRSPEVSTSMIHELIADAEFENLHIHDAAMPSVCSLVSDEFSPNGIHVSYSKWLQNRKEYLHDLNKANVYFAPRLYETTPHAILEAMCLGMCVVAPDLPSANEYINNRDNGLLYDQEDPVPLDFSNAESIGQNARRSVELGFDRWLENRGALFEYLTGTPVDQWDWTDSLRPEIIPKTSPRKTTSIQNKGKKEAKQSTEGGKRLTAEETESPVLTVVTVVKNSESVLGKTIKSVFSQTFDNFEYIIVDGMSSDGTIEIICQYDSLIDYWTSDKDEGPYQAMSKAVNLARGQYIVFLNAGDWFASPLVLEQVFENMSEDPDIVYGDHIWLNQGTPHFHKSLPFSAIQGILYNGNYQTAHWYQGLPNHQSTFVKTQLLRKWPLDTKYKIAADFDFLFKMAGKGASFMQIDLLISVYPAGGISGQNEKLCHEEWRQVFSEYGKCDGKKIGDGGIEQRRFAKCITSPAMQATEIFPGQHQVPTPSSVSIRFKAFAPVNECSRVYLTTPCLNAIDTIDQTIFSVVSQSGSNFALRYHIQDGGSTDGTIERLREWDRMLSSSSTGKLSGRWKNVIFSFSSEMDDGMYDAITRAIDFMAVPHTAILSWINADDILFQGAIATMVKVFRKYPQVHWATGHNCLLSYQGEVIGYNDEAKPSEYIRAGFCDGQNWRFVQQEGIFFRKWLWDRVGGFNQNLKYAADWDLWRRFADYADLVHFPGPIAAFRLRRGQISGVELEKYMDEIENIVSSIERAAEAKRLSAETGKNLNIASVFFRNNRYSLENNPLRNFRIPHSGRKLFKNSGQDTRRSNSLPAAVASNAVTPSIDQEGIETIFDTNKNPRSPFDNKVTDLKHAPDVKGVIFYEGWHSAQKDNRGWIRWSCENGVIHLESVYGGRATLSFRIGSVNPGNTINFDINGKSVRCIEIDRDIKIIKNMPIKVRPGVNILVLSSRPESMTSHGDSDNFSFMVGDFSFTAPKIGFKRGKWSKIIKLRNDLFYERFYANQFKGDGELNMAPVTHYLLYGAWQGKDPNPMFSSYFYLNKYKDVYYAGMNPLLHYSLHGWKEGRDPHPEFSTVRYLNGNDDVKQSGMNPLSHYLLHGVLEGRKIYPSN